MKKIRIKDICTKGSSTLKQKELLTEGTYPVYGASGIAGYLNSFQQEEPYIGIVKDGSIGKVNFYPPQTSLIGTMQYIFPKVGYDMRYVGYCLKSIDFLKYKQGSVIPHIYFRDYGEHIVNVTDDRAEQQAIVSRLDSAFAKIDALKANAEKQLNDAKALFQKELSKAMTPKEEWEEKKFGEVCTFVRGPFGGSLKKNCFKKSGYAVYEQQNAIYNRFTFRYFIDEKKYREMERFSIQSGDLIMSCSGTIGKVAIIPDEAAKGIINQALLKLSPKKNIGMFYKLTC
ncbi:MAG: restriction endonuclease subunit S [Prevotella sp.]|nr:restriction endonuclease subunit S [Prevotella sp.]